MNVADRAPGAVIGALVGNALGLGPHWYYDLTEFRKDYGNWITGYTNPKPGRYHSGMKAAGCRKSVSFWSSCCGRSLSEVNTRKLISPAVWTASCSRILTEVQCRAQGAPSRAKAWPEPNWRTCRYHRSGRASRGFGRALSTQSSESCEDGLCRLPADTDRRVDCRDDDRF
jgi:hypothetical protein